ncbi:MAG: hypothetical protein VKJ24_05045 [Synechococcales bacterium]|nr:hypothetical protein [Synechococcales bacterium]
MSSPLIHAFFVGRAIAEVLSEQAERTFNEILSDLGKFDAEQRERMRNFVQEVNHRVSQTESSTFHSGGDGAIVPRPSADLQALIDDLRAEMAEVRAELQRYRSGMN